MTSLKLAALFLASLAQTSSGAHWTERYFGVGSGEERTLACKEARGHADGNSTNACVDKRGTRADAEYTECICSALGEGEHVCNVNLKVACDGGKQADGKSSLIRSGGEPKGRVGRIATGRGPRVRRGRPGLLASPSEGRWSGSQR
ncbi:MAG TPA: hypothetical protein VH083_08245 [Myxococcales bacterium]|jgi:hypothetical protein|nr:hypothetical protein [Myxococcales bacterium]